MICTIYFESAPTIWNDRMKSYLFHNPICGFMDNEYDVYVSYWSLNPFYIMEKQEGKLWST